MRKLRPDRKIILTPSQHQQLIEKAETQSLNELTKWLKSECGIKTNKSALSDYLSRFPNRFEQVTISEASCRMIAEMTSRLVLQALKT